MKLILFFAATLIAQADRDGKGPALAGAYDGSRLKILNDDVTEQYLLETSDLPPEVQAQLSVKHETVSDI